MATIARPARLNDLSDPPEVVYGLGDPTILSLPTVTLVGSRRATAYGERIATAFGSAFARAGVCVISGLALGIDVAAQRAALDAGGRVCAVLGTSVDVSYPLANRAVQSAIASTGLLLSEYPPGMGARPWHFPQRNRLMAALGQATIVIEAGVNSGALTTAAVALHLGRAVGAVPGNIDSPESMGSNALLHDLKVSAITDVASALALLNVAPFIRQPRLEPDEEAIWRVLPATSVEDLVRRSALTTARCLSAMASLELAQAISIGYDGAIRRNAAGDIT
ncbi:MAG TPA: DNA-processing protein DprA [Gemmatimonadaceae bacterium]|nr:DNA-processing protein DprA [Gemmatimonadaceae bacterium]